jgi:uncharacterized membrane protein
MAPRSHWHRHPGVRSDDQLSRGERAADLLRNSMGSWGFVFGALLFLAGWMVGNRNVGFDPYPFILLNLILSCLAAMQGAILLIAAKRQDQVASELAMHDYDVNQATEQIVEAIHTLTSEIHDKVVTVEKAAKRPTTKRPATKRPATRRPVAEPGD